MKHEAHHKNKLISTMTSSGIQVEEENITSQALFWYGSFGIIFYQYQEHQHVMGCTKFGMVLLFLVL